MDATFFGMSRFNYFLVIDAAQQISGNHNRIFFNVSLFHIHSFANTPFKCFNFRGLHSPEQGMDKPDPFIIQETMD